MTAQIIDGKAIAAEVRAGIAERIKQRKAEGLTEPGLATVLVGDDPASKIHVKNKIKTCDQLGIRSFSQELPADTSQKQLEEIINALNADSTVHGILVQLPLPDHLQEERVLSLIKPQKDVDGIHPFNAGLLSRKYSRPLFLPCTPAGIVHLIHSVCPDITGMEAVIIGRSSIVGMPTALLLSRENATPTICHSYTKELSKICRRADILVAAAGSPELVRGDWVKPGAIVIDVGINHVSDDSLPKGYRLTGDVAFNEVIEVAKAITPVPGGVGPMTIAMLMKNTLRAAEKYAV